MKGFLFAGQGQQFLLMGKDLAETYPLVKEIYDTAHSILDYNLFDLTEEQLQTTRYTQPALFVLNHAICTILEKYGVDADATCGLSLGEYNALVCANVISFEDALKIIIQRSNLMQNAFEPFTTAMLACIKTDQARIQTLLQDSPVEICNINTQSQIVIGGLKSDIEKIQPLLKEAGVKAIPIKMSTVSHMSLLDETAKQLNDELQVYSFNKPTVPFINNISGFVQENDFVRSLSQHIARPTQFLTSIQTMQSLGVKTFIDIGPKGTLSKFVKEICGKETETFNIYNLDTLRSFMNE
ncbi:ACP S-malonyltransferase [Erysipelothrix urinaevulpis]|uniref:ACP S-malonyltransferase n=1 Tax=Erysipelothrix urinaevulpis TaxID=2683717 RepID=UPI00135C1D0C|nr:ACP S-malonyltransferase [Erysipelothrix urinaevulpis]